MRMMNPAVLFLLRRGISIAWVMVMGVFFLTSCSVKKHMEGKTAELIRSMDAVPYWESLPRQELSWNQAMKMMMEKNMDLQKSQQSLRQAERALTDVFTQLIPGVNLDWMLTKELSELASVGPGDVEYNTNILFNVPSLTQIPFDYYSAKAAEYTAKKTIEMKKRELVSRLYRQVLLYEGAQINYRHQLDSIPYDDHGEQKARIKEEWDTKVREISQGFCDLFGNMDAQWLVAPKTMPRVAWNKYKKASQKLDVLVVTLVALELEASRLQVLNAKMKFFPSVDINFYSPSLFSQTGGTYQGFFAGGGDMQVNMSLREELDTRLTSWFQYKTAKENHQLMQKQVRMDLMQRRDKVFNLMLSRSRFEVWKSLTMKQVAFLKSRQTLSGDDYLEQRESLKKLYEELDSESVKNAEVEAALIMEYGWL